MGRASRAAALVIVTGLLSGCGTMANLSTGKREGWKNVQIYGGVRRDVQAGGEWFAHSWVAPEKMEIMQDIGSIVGMGLVGIDVPLSAVADTLTLPVTIPASIWGRPRNEANGPRQTVSQPSALSNQPPPVSAPP